MPSYSPSTISPKTFSHLLSLYPATIERVYREKLSKSSKPKSKSKSTSTSKDDDADIDEKLTEFLELDRWRYEVLPALVRDREKEEGGKEKGRYLTKEEVERLVGWKLKHGKHRPTLLSLIRSNDASLIEQTTRHAYAASLPLPAAEEDEEDEAEEQTFQLNAVNTLTSLRGVGPATASLLLSVLDGGEESVFFGDEVWGWVCGGGVKYTVKEYERLWEGARRVRGRVGGGEVRMGDVERVGFVVGNLAEGEREELEGLEEGDEVEEKGEDGVKDVEDGESEAKGRRGLRKRKHTGEKEKETAEGRGRKKRKG